ncbi:hypothetical protein EVAR_101208_1 [Eumeta japonica]|uniref:Histone-lysine N-methyltransferase SETMAR n=1 Tax=Eumeta variegata TaxID=151549 RepID=A0A4C2A9V1_EUMVA|nr:hypothetical protein EVAR_101208_1 [Eumeta japonica]
MFCEERNLGKFSSLERPTVDVMLSNHKMIGSSFDKVSLKSRPPSEGARCGRGTNSRYNINARRASEQIKILFCMHPAGGRAGFNHSDAYQHGGQFGASRAFVRGQLRRRPRLMGVGPRASAWDRRYRVSWDLKVQGLGLTRDEPDTLRVNLPPYPKVARWCAGVKRRRTTNEDDPRPGRPTTAVAADMLKEVERNCSSRSSGSAVEEQIRGSACCMSTHVAGKRLAVVAIRDAGFEMLEISPYSPELVPHDFYAFPKLKWHLKGQRFEEDEAVVAAE